MIAVCILVWFSTASAAIAAEPANVPDRGDSGHVLPALETGVLGLYPVTDFHLAQGTCVDCPTPKQALWYFRDDFIAVPKPGVRSAGFSRGVAPQQDIRLWYAGASDDDMRARPTLVWVGSPTIVNDAILQPAGDELHVQGSSVLRFRLTPKISSNRSYYDATSAVFFQRRSLRIRGRIEQDANGKSAVVARTIWPQDYIIDESQSKLAPLSADETLSGLVRQTGSIESRYETRLLWERNPGQPRNWKKLAALGIMLNGAQGDDDEAHGGHFAIVTGLLGPRGEWADWMVNNFYNLDAYSEKGIIASMVPMDNYLMDLNSGQSYYRPSYMLVALLRSDQVAHAYQGAIQRVFNHFYRHDIRYQHAAANCAGISLDTLRALGWNIPTRGPTSYVKAVAAYPYMSIKEMSLESGKKSFDYLSEEQTRLHPEVAFDAAGNDLLQLVGALPGNKRQPSAYEQLLKRDVEAIVFVRIPQIPSSRARGTFPVASIDEYMKRTPEDRSQWKIVPVDARPFPAEFKDSDTEADDSYAAWMVAVGIVLIGCGLIVRAARKRRARPS